MVSIDQQDHGGTVSIAAIYSIPLLYAHATIVIRLVATVGVAEMRCCGRLLEITRTNEAVWIHCELCGFCMKEEE